MNAESFPAISVRPSLSSFMAHARYITIITFTNSNTCSCTPNTLMERHALLIYIGLKNGIPWKWESRYSRRNAETINPNLEKKRSIPTFINL